MKKLVNWMCIVSIIFSIMVMTATSVWIFRHDTYAENNITENTVSENTLSNKQGVFVIPIPEGTAMDGITVQPVLEEKRVTVLIKGADSSFYYNHPLNGETRQVAKLMYGNSDESAQIEIFLNEYCRCEWQISDNDVRLGFTPIKEAYDYIVVLDAGHMENKLDYGTVMNQVKESTVNYELAALLRQELEIRGIGAVLTRWQDETAVSQESRELLRAEIEPDMEIDIHCGGDARTRVTHGLDVSGDSGFSEYIEGYLKGRGYVFSDMTESSISDESAVTEADAGILSLRLCAGYLTNAADAKQLSDSEYLRMLAEAMAQGLKEYLENK